MQCGECGNYFKSCLCYFTPPFIIGYGNAVTTFTQNSYTITVNEQVDENKGILQFQTTDDCVDVTFAIVSGNDNYTFRIHKKTGIMYRYGIIDSRLNTYFMLTVAAYVSTSPSLFATYRNASVLIQIPIINHKPVFSYPQDKLDIAVYEDISPNTDIFILSGYDGDVGANGTFTYMLTTSNAYFKIGTNSGILSTKQNLTKSNVSLSVNITDQGSPPLSSELLLNIVISTPKPYFVYEIDKFELCGIWTAGGHVVKLQALPLGYNFTYGIIGGNEHNDFRVDVNTGELYANNTLDGDRQSTYNLTIDAFNVDNIGADKQLTVNINVCRLSLLRPKMLQDRYTVTIPKDIAKETILDLDAFDIYDQPFNSIDYSLVNKDVGQPFVVEKTTGKVFLNSSLEKVDPGIYVMNIDVCNLEYPSFCYEKTVNVTIAVTYQGNLFNSQ